VSTMARRKVWSYCSESWGMGAEEFREAPMMHQKVPTLGRTNYTIDETRRNIYHWV